MDISNVSVISRVPFKGPSVDPDDTWGTYIESSDDTYVPEYNDRAKEKAICEFHTTLMDHCGLSRDTCTIIINYLPFQHKWVRFNPITCDGVASILSFIFICIHNFFHFIIGFIFTSDSLLISIAFIILSVVESFFIFYFYKFKYNCFVEDNLMDMAKSLNNWFNFTIQICIYVPMTILLFILTQNTLMQLLFLIFYMYFIIAQSISHYRQFTLKAIGPINDVKDVTKIVHPSIYFLLSLAIMLLHDIYTRRLVYDNVDAYYALPIFTFYGILIGNIMSTIKMSGNPGNIINPMFLSNNCSHQR